MVNKPKGKRNTTSVVLKNKLKYEDSIYNQSDLQTVKTMIAFYIGREVENR